jgi:hypothetical protein
MLRKAALLFGVVFVLIGALGFVPALTPVDDAGMPLLLGLFMVGVLHNIIHLASGVAAFLGSKSEEGASLYFKVFGVIYAIVTVVGFIQGDTVLGLIHVNLADNILHLAIAAATLGLGFGVKPKTV